MILDLRNSSRDLNKPADYVPRRLPNSSICKRGVKQ